MAGREASSARGHVVSAKEAEQPLPPGTYLTIRVSRDGGRTWGERQTYVPDRKSAPLEAGSRYPLCECHRCVRPQTDA